MQPPNPQQLDTAAGRARPAVHKPLDILRPAPAGHDGPEPAAPPTPVLTPAPQVPQVTPPNPATVDGVLPSTTPLPSALPSQPPVHWSKKPESFPVPSGSTIKLPSGTPKAIPRVQYAFTTETAAQRADRLRQLLAIKAAFTRTWNGYRQYAWMKDELRPVSGGFHTKFGGWAATLVDSLDTLWIMDMKEEFEEAVNAARDIDFTTADRQDIPMFETTIRYLGGFLGAYDVSGGKYKVLLEKAVELAEVLIGAFDTPNRMPILYYAWAGSRSSNPVRAPDAVLAEIGSLSVEFTRLAQLTQEPKYYDAIARITNELEIFQNKTDLPGMWPLHLVIAGCGTEEDIKDPVATPEDGPDSRKDTSTWGVDRTSVVDEPAPITDKQMHQKDKSSFGDEDSKVTKRQIYHGDGDDEANDDEAQDDESNSEKNCPPGGFQNGFGKSQFTIGGEADSTYEYLPKEYLLLGGLEDQYRSMYINSVETIKEYLLYRPMIEDEKRELRFTGKFLPQGPDPAGSTPINGTLDPSLGHLTCFQGGMFALGAKIFGRKEELDLAWKLTDGCVWAYESSASGIMPEDLTPVMCPTLADCPWNQTAWHLAIDPAAATRTSEAQDAQELARQTETSMDLLTDGMPGAPLLTTDVKLDHPDKRQVDATELLDDEDAPTTTLAADVSSRQTSAASLADQSTPHSDAKTNYIENRIKSEGLWPGIKIITNTRYLLRPEAIESVWYMYRITGDDYWRQKGWKMFEAVEAKTRTEFGNSAINSVVSQNVVALDEMESFWTAETLKYFYLLFSDPGVISLDDYVLNTEAHPLLRPDARKT